jgi:hypothetical protein
LGREKLVPSSPLVKPPRKRSASLPGLLSDPARWMTANIELVTREKKQIIRESEALSFTRQ